MRVGADPRPEGGGGCWAAQECAVGASRSGSLALRRPARCVQLGAAPRPSRPAGRPLWLTEQMAVRGANTLTPFSIQAILNKKEERGGLPAPEGRSVPGGTAVAVAEAPAVCCWRLFGETDVGALGGAEDSLLASPAGTRTAAGRTAESLVGWDSDSALSEENEGGRRCADAPGASGAGCAGGTLGLGQPVCELPAAKDLEEEAAGRSDSEMSASVSGLPRLGGEGAGQRGWLGGKTCRMGWACCEYPTPWGPGAGQDPKLFALAQAALILWEPSPRENRETPQSLLPGARPETSWGNCALDCTKRKPLHPAFKSIASASALSMSKSPKSATGKIQGPGDLE